MLDIGLIMMQIKVYISTIGIFYLNIYNIDWKNKNEWFGFLMRCVLKENKLFRFSNNIDMNNTKMLYCTLLAAIAWSIVS